MGGGRLPLAVSDGLPRLQGRGLCCHQDGFATGAGAVLLRVLGALDSFGYMCCIPTGRCYSIAMGAAGYEQVISVSVNLSQLRVTIIVPFCGKTGAGCCVAIILGKRTIKNHILQSGDRKCAVFATHTYIFRTHPLQVFPNPYLFRGLSSYISKAGRKSYHSVASAFYPPPSFCPSSPNVSSSRTDRSCPSGRFP